MRCGNLRYICIHVKWQTSGKWKQSRGEEDINAQEDSIKKANPWEMIFLHIITSICLPYNQIFSFWHSSLLLFRSLRFVLNFAFMCVCVRALCVRICVLYCCLYISSFFFTEYSVTRRSSLFRSTWQCWLAFMIHSLDDEKSCITREFHQKCCALHNFPLLQFRRV